MTEHHLKCLPEYYAAIESGAKTCELRLNDRNYQRGDALLLKEYEPIEPGYTGREMRVRVTHILAGGEWLAPGYIAMSIRLMGDDGRARVQEDFVAVANRERERANKAEKECDEARAEIEQARKILSALEGETLVQAAADLAHEYETTHEAYHNIHHRYWKEAVPEIAALRARADAAERGGG